MYNSFPNQVSSAAKWIVFALFGVIGIAILLGANLKDAKWLNPNIAEAEAQRIQVEAAHQQATYELQERLTAAQTDAEIQQIQREQKLLDVQYEAEIQKIAQDVANRQRWADVKINLVIFAGGALSIVTTLGGLIIAIAKAIAILQAAPKATPITATPLALPEMQVIHPLPERQPYEPLEVPQVPSESLEQLYDRRLAERWQELTQKQNEADVLIARMKAVIDPAQMSREKYNRQPLAGD